MSWLNAARSSDLILLQFWLWGFVKDVPAVPSGIKCQYDDEISRWNTCHVTEKKLFQNKPVM